jgi:hypothetical protein
MLKSKPVLSNKDNFCSFNGWITYPYEITRNEAAKMLILLRQKIKIHQAKIENVEPGVYVLTSMNSVVLKTRF